MKVLYATDGSEGSLAGAGFLAKLTLEPDSQILLLTVVTEADRREPEAVQAPARELLRHMSASLRSEVRHGYVAEEILRAAEEHRADLLVVGSRGLSGLARFFLGSVAERVVRHAPCPVLLARPLVNDLRLAILATDGSLNAARAAEWLRQFPLPEACEIWVTQVMPFMEAILPYSKRHWPPMFAELYEQQCREARERVAAVADAFAETGRPSRADLRSGDPAESLIRAVEEHKADLIVVGASGITAIERFMLGSVSEKVLRHVPCSVLVVK